MIYMLTAAQQQLVDQLLYEINDARAIARAGGLLIEDATIEQTVNLMFDGYIPKNAPLKKNKDK